ALQRQSAVRAELASPPARRHHEPMRDGHYREVPPAPGLAAHVQCLWYRRIGPDEALRPVRIVPDGCMDLMWQEGELLVAGPDTTAQVTDMPAGTEIVGLRFQPGAAPPLLGVPASELLDARPDAAAVWGRRAADVGARLEAVRTPAEVAAVLQAAVRRRLADAPPPDRAVQRLVLALERGRAVRV